MRRSRVLAAALSTLALASAGAQRPTRDHYTPSLGIAGGATLQALHSDGVERYEQQVGWTTGAWFNLPLGFGLSLEPQLHYLSMPSRASNASTGRARTLLDNATIGALSAPLLLKLHIGRFAALTVGGEALYALRVGDTPNYWTTDSISALTFSGTGGLELFPHGRVALFGRYSLGLTNLNPTVGSSAASQIRLRGAQAGLKVRLAGRRVYADGDGDGLRDRTDKCPAQAGLPVRQGCPIPDTDRDGVLDDVDECPNEVGPATTRGCAPKAAALPVLDRDADGVPDATDRCPVTAGAPALEGCPDSDHDGYEDAVDKCPTAVGTSTPRGCPRLTSFRPSDVTFVGVSAQLTSVGRAELDKVTAYLQMYPTVSAEFVGHVDARMPLDAGLGLSVRRAEAARDFVNMQGIALERLSIRGEGGRRPLTSSSTVEGRLLNRRVDVILR